MPGVTVTSAASSFSGTTNFPASLNPVMVYLFPSVMLTVM